MGDPESHFLVTFELLLIFRGFGGARRSTTSQLKTLVLLGSALKRFRELFDAVRAILWLWGSFLAS